MGADSFQLDNLAILIYQAGTVHMEGAGGGRAGGAGGGVWTGRRTGLGRGAGTMGSVWAVRSILAAGSIQVVRSAWMAGTASFKCIRRFSLTALAGRQSQDTEEDKE